MSKRGGRRLAWSDTPLVSDPAFKAARGLLWAFVVVIILTMYPLASDAFDLPKSSIGRVIVAAVFACLLILTARFGRYWTWSPIYGAVGGLLAAHAISAALAVDTQSAVFGFYRRYLGLTEDLTTVVLFAGAALLLRRANDIRWTLLVLAGASSASALYALAQHSGFDPFKWTQGDVTVRAFATFGQPDVASGFFSIVTPLLLAGAFVSRRSARSLGAVLLVAGILCIGGLVVTDARSGLVGLVAAGSACGYLALAQRSVGRWPTTAAGAVLILAAIFPAIAPALAPSVIRNDQSFAGRVPIWQTAIAEAQARPLLGLGPDNFGVGFFSFHPGVPLTTGERNESQDSAHNWALQELTSAGAVGLVLLMLVWLWAADRSVLLARQNDSRALALVPLAAYLGQGLVDVNAVSLDWIPWLALGVLCRDPGPGRVSAGTRRRSSVPAVLAAVVGVAVVLVPAASAASRFQASVALLRVDVLQAQGSGDAAAAIARDAITHDARRAEHWSFLGTALAAAGKPNTAADAFIAAANRAPYQPLFWKNFALMRLTANQPELAKAALRRALRADAYDPDSLDLLARIAYGEENWHDAIRYGERLVYLTPDVAAAYEIPARSYAATGQVAAGLALVRGGAANYDSVGFHIIAAQILIDAKRFDDARVEVQRAIELDPSAPQIRLLQQQLGLH